jgi:hypothetical protein
MKSGPWRTRGFREIEKIAGRIETTVTPEGQDHTPDKTCKRQVQAPWETEFYREFPR